MSLVEDWATVGALAALVAFISFIAFGALDPDTPNGIARARALAVGACALVFLAVATLARDLGVPAAALPALIPFVALAMAISRERTASSRNLRLPKLSISRPPGAWLLRLADSACRRSTSKLVLEMVADMRLEYFEALKDGRKIKAAWIKALHYVAMARALTLDRLLTAGLSYVLGAFRTGKS